MHVELAEPQANLVKVSLGPQELIYINAQGLLAATHQGDAALTPAGFGLSCFANSRDTTEIWLSGPMPGSACVIELEQQSVIVDQNAILAVQPALAIAKAANFSCGQQRSWLSVTGSGSLIISTYGAIYPLQVDSEYSVNVAYIAAFSQSLHYRQDPQSTSYSRHHPSPLSYTFIGQGLVWCQTHDSARLASQMNAQRK